MNPQRYVIRGLMFLLPLALTAILVSWIYSFSQQWLGGLTNQIVIWLLPDDLLARFAPGGHIPGLSLVVLVALFGAVGLIASWRVGAQGLRLIDHAFLLIPGVRTVYASVRKVIDAIGDNTQSRFQKVVWVEWGGMRCIGFVTGYSNPSDGSCRKAFLFVPTVPNPTSGFVFVVSEDQLEDAGVTPEEAFKMLVSLGVLTPASIKAPCGPTPGHSPNQG